MRKSRRWLLASIGASAAGLASGATEAPKPKPAPVGPNCAKAGDPEPFECEVDLGGTALPQEARRPSILLEKFKLGVALKGGGQITVGAGIEDLLWAAYGDAEWKQFQQDTWCLVVVQAHILGQLAAYHCLLKKQSGPLEPRNVLRAWTLFDDVMSSAHIKDWVEHPLATGSKNAFKLPWMPPDPSSPIGKPRCWTSSGPHIKQVDQPCALCT